MAQPMPLAPMVPTYGATGPMPSMIEAPPAGFPVIRTPSYVPPVALPPAQPSTYGAPPMLGAMMPPMGPQMPQPGLPQFPMPAMPTAEVVPQGPPMPGMMGPPM